MPMITETPSLTPAGIARYVGAAVIGSVIQLTNAPSDVGSGGVPLPANPTGEGDLRTVRYVDLIPTDTGVNATYLGETPTATFGFDIGSGDQMKNASRPVLAAMKIFIPPAVILHVRYWWGTR
jgi:hypothetical protein